MSDMAARACQRPQSALAAVVYPLHADPSLLKLRRELDGCFFFKLSPWLSRLRPERRADMLRVVFCYFGNVSMQAGAMRSQPAKSVLTLIGRTTVPSEAFSRFINRRDAPQFVRFNK